MLKLSRAVGVIPPTSSSSSVRPGSMPRNAAAQPAYSPAHPGSRPEADGRRGVVAACRLRGACRHRHRRTGLSRSGSRGLTARQACSEPFTSFAIEAADREIVVCCDRARDQWCGFCNDHTRHDRFSIPQVAKFPQHQATFISHLLDLTSRKGNYDGSHARRGLCGRSSAGC